MRAAGLVFTLTLTALFAAEAEELRYRFAEGETLRYRVTQTATFSGNAGPAGAFEMQATQVTELAWKVTAVDDKGVATIEQTVPKLKFTNSSPLGKVGFDSESDEPPMGVAAMLTPAVRTLLESEVTFTVSPTGEVTRVRAPEELIGSLERVPGASEVIKAEPVIQALVEAVLPRLPAGDKVVERSALPPTGSLAPSRLVTEFRLGAMVESGVERILSRVVVRPASDSLEVLASSGQSRINAATGRLLGGEASLSLRMMVAGADTRVVQQATVEMIGGDPATDDKVDDKVDDKTADRLGDEVGTDEAPVQ